MRRGYWKTLLRRLRDRVASGSDTLVLTDTSFVIAQICASDDDSLETLNEIILAEDAEGRRLVLDPVNAAVSLRVSAAPPQLATGVDFPGMIAALTTQGSDNGALGAHMDGADLMLRKSTRRNIFDE